MRELSGKFVIFAYRALCLGKTENHARSWDLSIFWFFTETQAMRMIRSVILGAVWPDFP